MNEEEFASIVAQHRDEPASRLDFSPCIERLIDKGLCRELVNHLETDGRQWERRVAVENLHISLPQVCGVYMFVWRPSFEFVHSTGEKHSPFWILYIGKAGKEGGSNDTIQHRYQTEYSKYVGKSVSVVWNQSPSQTRSERLAKYLTLRPLEYWFLQLTELNDIGLLERQLIRTFRPPLNRHHGAVLRAQKPEPAF